jgi:adenosylhomocysteine nucleosidase
MGAVDRPPGRIGIVVGLPQEAAILKRALGKTPSLLVCSGAQAARAAQGAAELVAGGATMLLSFGFAGGLDPSLRPGNLVVGAGVVAADGRRQATDDALAQRLCAALDAAGCRWSAGLVADAAHAVETAAAKQALFVRTRAVIVDMESRAVAEAGLPFAILRAVVDPAERALPSSALAALKPSGRIDSLTLIGGLLRRPSEIGTLLALARDSAAARVSLGRAAAAARGALGLV